MKEINENLDFENLFKKMKFSKIDFVRGLGIVEDRFELLFEFENERINFEIETNFRVRNRNNVLLSFNDLYLDYNRKEMSVRKYRSQTNIEKSYLHKQLELLNTILKDAKPKKIITKSYGDVNISFAKDGIVLEILNDTHLENASLYRIKYKNAEIIYTYECNIKNNQLVFNKVNF
ncbi:MAG: hypothetical protein K2H06_04760 [Anaeroplasmataceae bacterium]|nr:hypothetical protein [Anaeroplasmataceae bacterium]